LVFHHSLRLAKGQAHCATNLALFKSGQICIVPKVRHWNSGFNHQLSMLELADLGMRRISVGSGLALAAWGAFLRAAQDIKTNGTFNLLSDNAPSADLNALFQQRA